MRYRLDQCLLESHRFWKEDGEANLLDLTWQSDSGWSVAPVWNQLELDVWSHSSIGITTPCGWRLGFGCSMEDKRYGVKQCVKSFDATNPTSAGSWIHGSTVSNLLHIPWFIDSSDALVPPPSICHDFFLF